MEIFERNYKLFYLPVVFLSLFLTHGSFALQSQHEKFELKDINQIKDIGSLDVSKDADLIAYTVSSVDQKNDEYVTDIWMLNFKKDRDKLIVRSAYSPKFSPDSNYVAYLAPGRGKYSDYQQLWFFNTKTATKRQMTKIESSVTDFEWSPDGNRIVMVINIEPEREDEGATQKPYVIDRYQFKQDNNDFLDESRQHLFLIEIARRKLTQLTDGSSNEIFPSWSPDGNRIAYVTKIGDIDRHDNWDIYVLKLDSNENPIQLTTHLGADSQGSRPQWSPDGKQIAYLYGGDPKLLWYAIQELAIIDLDTRTSSIITKQLDRNTSSPQWSEDGSSIFFVIEDNMKSQLAKYSFLDQKINTVTPPDYYLSGWSKNYAVRNGKIGLILSDLNSPDEIFFVDGKNLQQKSHQNAEFLSKKIISQTETISFTTDDGEEIFGMMVKPHNFDPSKKYPLIIRMHGGPVSQYGLHFRFDWQLFAANGYIVMAMNPRGSSGRGFDFQKVIFADWGNVDADDVSALADYAISLGYVDPQRLGLGGWSYGGMLTNYVIAKDSRFKAATSGAGISNLLSGFGDDHYIREYILELGTPWDNTEDWLRNSNPFFSAGNIKTPTLFLVGEKDYNVPLIGSEQMYQALKHLNIPTQLIIYPDENHSFSTPSYNEDVLRRYLDWYEKFLH